LTMCHTVYLALVRFLKSIGFVETVWETVPPFTHKLQVVMNHRKTEHLTSPSID
jgi:hypothetical protein